LTPKPLRTWHATSLRRAFRAVVSRVAFAVLREGSATYAPPPYWARHAEAKGRPPWAIASGENFARLLIIAAAYTKEAGVALPPVRGHRANAAKFSWRALTNCRLRLGASAPLANPAWIAVVRIAALRAGRPRRRHTR